MALWSRIKGVDFPYGGTMSIPDPNLTPAAAGEPVTDTWNVRLVIVALALIALVSVAGGIVLSGMGKPIPDQVVGIGSAAAGALGAILASTRGLRT